jgi:hypothetical protein
MVKHPEKWLIEIGWCIMTICLLTPFCVTVHGQEQNGCSPSPLLCRLCSLQLFHMQLKIKGKRFKDVLEIQQNS